MWPVRDIASQFPELSRFDERRRRLFVRQAKRSGRGRHQRRTWLFAGVASACTVVWMVAVFVAPRATQWVSRSMSVTEILAATIAICLVGGGPLVACAAWMWLDRGWVRKSVRARIDAPECSACGFALRGLPVVDSIARCPECGMEQVVVG